MHGFAVDDKLRDRIWVHVHSLPHAARDLFVLHQGQEHIDKLDTVGWSYCLQDLSHKVPWKKMNAYYQSYS